MIVGQGNVVLIGESPAVGGSPEGALEGPSGRRLADLCGVSFDRYLELFARTNLCDVPGSYSREGALLTTRRLTDQLVGRRVVLLGSRVVAAWGMRPRLFAWQKVFADGDRRRAIRVAHAPHPSGRSRYWNDAEAAARAREFWEATARLAAELLLRGPK